MNNTIILIPSRLSAIRLPNKPLLKINNTSIINHVYQKAVSAEIGDTYVATGDNKIYEEVTKNGGKCILTEKKHKTGTDRIFEAFQKLNNKEVEYVINLQGDEPMINIDDVKNLHKQAINNKSKIATLACEIKNEIMLNKKDIVKVITEEKLSKNSISKAKKFLRKVLKNNQENVYHHIGIYLYKVSILEKFVNLKQTKNEISQKLEQLRAMENNISIDVNLANSSPIGVDTKEDYLEIKKLMEYKN
ncbi:MAG: 3-deoxy-manno-octulosonate cytidylyltransferase [Legionellales bacterium]|nr:3-deoxy-manno-octulosonate cytidylyltransferase [Legionellales bacterium]